MIFYNDDALKFILNSRNMKNIFKFKIYKVIKFMSKTKLSHLLAITLNYKSRRFHLGIPYLST